MRSLRTPGLSAHLGLLLGLGLAAFSLARYTSYDARPVLGRWSYEFTVVLLVLSLVWLVGFGLLVLRMTSRRSGPTVFARPEVGILSAAVLVWGLGDLFATAANPDSASRVLALNLAGSVHPFATFTDWTALTLVCAAVLVGLWRTIPTRGQGILLMGSSLVVLFLGMEGLARLRAHYFPAVTGYPSYSGQLWESRYVRLNALGFRGPEPGGVEKEWGRLLLIGDSFAFGSGIESLDDRFDGRLIRALSGETGRAWDSQNGGVADTHTLDHIAFLERFAWYRPDLVVLEYVFNDMDYLADITSRSGPVEAPGSLLGRLRPGRVAYLNSYLYQEIYVRVRHVVSQAAGSAPSPYDREELLQRHFGDLDRFVRMAREAGAAVRIVPFDISVVASDGLAKRYRDFVAAATEHGLPICDLSGAFEGYAFGQLVVNRLDAHPNALANRLAADYVAPCLRRALDEIHATGGEG